MGRAGWWKRGGQTEAGDWRGHLYQGRGHQPFVKGGRRAKGEEGTDHKRTWIRITTYLCFFSRFQVSSFLGASFSFLEGALCSLREVLPSFFLFSVQVLSAELRPRSPSSSRCLLRSACFLRGDPGPGLPPTRSFWPGWAPRLPAAPSALGARFFEGLLPDLSPAGAGIGQFWPHPPPPQESAPSCETPDAQDTSWSLLAPKATSFGAPGLG